MTSADALTVLEPIDLPSTLAEKAKFGVPVPMSVGVREFVGVLTLMTVPEAFVRLVRTIDAALFPGLPVPVPPPVPVPVPPVPVPGPETGGFPLAAFGGLVKCVGWGAEFNCVVGGIVESFVCVLVGDIRGCVLMLASSASMELDASDPTCRVGTSRFSRSSNLGKALRRTAFSQAERTRFRWERR